MSVSQTQPTPDRQHRMNRRHRKDRRAARKKAASRVMPPEGVPLELPVASVGVRVAAQLADVLITVAAAVSIIVLLSMLYFGFWSTIFAFGSLLFFLIRVPYYVLSELAWNGQTLGKKLMKIKVVAHDGGSLTAHSLILRNMMKEAEVFLPGTLLLTLDQMTPWAAWASLAWVAMALSIPLTNPHRMRLGDMLAGTHVVHLPEPILLKDLALEAPRATSANGQRFTFLPHQLDHYGGFELQTLEKLLRAQENRMAQSSAEQNRQAMTAIVERIRRKIGYADVVEPADEAAFLQAFYSAQRAHLEQRQLFGDRRADKFYADAQPDEEEIASKYNLS